MLRIALGRALKSGRVTRNEATLVDAPTKAEPTLSPLSIDEGATFLHEIRDDRLRALYIAAMGLGMRQGELLALRWQDVDMETGLVSVRHTLTLDRRELMEPKTERSRRTLRMPSVVESALREHRVAKWPSASQPATVGRISTSSSQRATGVR